MASAGAGRPVNKDGYADGPWTPDLLVNALGKIEYNEDGVELRTVQRWFQENEHNIGLANMRLLARVFGCGDPVENSNWQLELNRSRLQTISERKQKKTSTKHVDHLFEQKQPNANVSVSAPSGISPVHRFNLARWSEAIFCGSPLNLPSFIFAGTVALGLSSYLLGIHNVTYGSSDVLIKQVGFMWAPNWTLLFMVFMPLFCVFVNELVVFWKNEGRNKFLMDTQRTDGDVGWTRKVENSSHTYWCVLIICLGFVGIFQWVGVRLNTLINGVGNYTIDWGTLALVRPDIISVPQAVAFTGFAYLYMCICFYLFFVGLILLFTLVFDLWEIGSHSNVVFKKEADELGLRVLRGIFRCTLLGIMIAICMKLKSFYMTSSGTDIISWLVDDMLSILNTPDGLNNVNAFRMPTHFTSLVVTLATCIPFLYGSVRIGLGSRFHWLWAKMVGVVVLLIAGYLLIGAFAGSTVILAVGLLFSAYGMFDPTLGQSSSNIQRDNPSVS
jgi:hypothetical protein